MDICLQTLSVQRCELLTVCCIGCSLFSVLWYNFMNLQMYPFFSSNQKMLSHLELNFKGRPIELDVRF